MVIHLTSKLITAIGWRASVPQQTGLSHSVVRVSEKQTFTSARATIQEINMEAAIFCSLTSKCIFDDCNCSSQSSLYERRLQQGVRGNMGSGDVLKTRQPYSITKANMNSKFLFRS